MKKTRIEVCPDEQTARVRHEWLTQRGYQVETFDECEKVVVDARALGADQRVHQDDDASVWLVVASK